MTQTMDANVTPRVMRRRRSRWHLVITVSMIVVVGASVGWFTAKYFTGRVAETESVEVRINKSDQEGGANQAEATDERIAVQPPPAVARAAAPVSPQDTKAVPVPPSKTAPPKAKIREVKDTRPVVSSYPEGQAYDLSVWVSGKNRSGFIDSARLGQRAVSTNGAANALPQEGVLELSGWTGDRSIGVRYPYVLISACGKVVAHTDVTVPRPDVAKAVHKNLSQSGWTLKLALAHLPSCKNIVLEAWGVAPGDRKLILPLNGSISLSILRGARKVDPQATRIAAAPLLPAAMPTLPPVRLDVKAETLNIRRCADTQCSVVGKLAKGEWTVLTLDEADGWILVATPDRAGWVSKRYIGVQKPQG